MTSLRLIPETILLYLMYGLFSTLPATAASNLGGWIARSVGPKLGASRKARAHIKLAYPEKPSAEVESIVIAMWDNLGRVFAEYPHLETIALTNTRVIGDEIIIRAINEGNGGIFFQRPLRKLGNIWPHHASTSRQAPASNLPRHEQPGG